MKRSGTSRERGATADTGTGLRERVIEAASKLFAEHGYQSVSMRRIAEMAGCSQMAMYRHFEDKDDLIRYLCAEVYQRFADRLDRTSRGLPGPRERILGMVKATIAFAVSHPEHYRIAMMMSQPRPGPESLREPLAQALLRRLQEDVRALLPTGASEAEARQRLHQILACMHGMSMMLLSNPHTYGLTRETAIAEAQAAVMRLLEPDAGGQAAGTVARRRDAKTF